MEEMTANEILDDGMRRIKVVSDAEINAAQWQRRVPREARDLAKPLMEHDPALGIWTLELTYPARDVVFGALTADGGMAAGGRRPRERSDPFVCRYFPAILGQEAAVCMDAVPACGRGRGYGCGWRDFITGGLGLSFLRFCRRLT